MVERREKTLDIMTTEEEEMLNEEMKKEREWGNEGDREMGGQTLAKEREGVRERERVWPFELD